MVNHKLKELTVRLDRHEYPIYIGNRLLSNSRLLNRHIAANQVFIVTNEQIASYYLERVQQAFTTKQCDVVILPAGEMHKNQHSLSLIYDQLIKHGHHRNTTLIALGGGVIGDLTGFAAATYQRGTRFIQLPTTLLAQVDASVGGKTAINHPQGKNMVGSFYQPHAVIMDLDTLSTLPAREFYAGFGEIIKYGLLEGGCFLEKISALLTKEGLSPNAACLPDLIADCCRIKAQFVQEDEREKGRRALLNLGHTFAHALETYTNYQRWLHGEAVAIGLYCAALLSCLLGHLNPTEVSYIDSLLTNAHLPCRIPTDIDLQELHRLMFNDKKTQNKQLRLVLLRALGDCYLEENVSNDAVLQALRDAQL
jgi:3-dehydroquinate synthase